jgi:hypothetical protein
MSTKEDRPILGERKRRLPQPAPDEAVDPIDYRRPETVPSLPTTSRPAVAVQASAKLNPIGTLRGRPRREVTVSFATRLSPEVADLIDQAVANGEGGGVIRNGVEEAIRARWGSGSAQWSARGNSTEKRR